MTTISRKNSRWIGMGGTGALLVWLALLVTSATPATYAATLTVTPITWDIIGLDSNSPATGPYRFPVGARVCASGGTATDVVVDFDWLWDSSNADIYLRSGSLSQITIASIASGSCSDAYFEIEINRVASAFGTARGYRVQATATGFGTASTPIPRQLYVERLVSQHRNGITSVKLNGSVIPAGATMTVMVDGTYTIRLEGYTATQGYNQLEAFVNFPNTIFQVVSVSTSYTANDSPYVSTSNHDKVYADACAWEDDPGSPNYSSCTADYKTGGTVVTDYVVKIVGGAGTTEGLNALLYDFSGSSFHYNSDFTTGSINVVVINPSSIGFQKYFTPKTISPGGTSTLTFKLTNPTTLAFTGVRFTDALPSGMQVASTPGLTYSGCGSPSPSSLSAGATSLSFTNISLSANSVCTVSLSVTVPAAGTYTSTSGSLYLETSIDTGNTASDTLTASAAPTCTAGQTLASWTVPSGSANPPTPTGQAFNVTTATASANVPASTSITSAAGVDGTSWRTYGYKNAGQYIEFTVDTRKYSGVFMGFYVSNTSPANGPTNLVLSYNSGSGFVNILTVPTPGQLFTQHVVDFTGLTSTSGTTVFRLTGTNAIVDTSAGSLDYDNITFSGCGNYPPPTITQSFSSGSIKKGDASTLTVTINNTTTGSIPLTGIGFTDVFPSGVTIADSSTTQCSGTLTTTSSTRTVSLTGGSLASGASCSFTVSVTGTTEGVYEITSGNVTATQSGTNTGTTGYSTVTLTVVAPPVMTQSFSPSSIKTGETAVVSFTISNPNRSSTISGIGFTDTLAGGLVVSTPNGLSENCDGTVTATAGSTSISWASGSLAANSSCTISANVTASSSGTSTTSAVTSTQGGNGNTTAVTLSVSSAVPLIGLSKEISADNSTWVKFLGFVPPRNVYYAFTISNDGEAALAGISVTDPDSSITMASCTPALPTTLAVGATASCVVGPVTVWSAPSPNPHVNTATVTTTTYTPSTAITSTAKYGVQSMTIASSATETDFDSAGDTLHYVYTVTNTGGYPLLGPVTVTDSKATVSCPAVTTDGDGDDYLDPGESITCTATYTIVASDVTSGYVTNTSWVTVGGVTSPADSHTVYIYQAATATPTPTPTRTATPIPRAGDIIYLSATPISTTQIRIDWTTDTEVIIAGFNVWRASSPYIKLNSTLIPATYSGNTPGADYSYIDNDVVPGITYYYKIEIIGLDGSSRFPDPTDVYIASSNLYLPFVISGPGPTATPTRTPTPTPIPLGSGTLYFPFTSR